MSQVGEKARTCFFSDELQLNWLSRRGSDEVQAVQVLIADWFDVHSWRL